jgi:hypothetical protein
MAVDFHLLVWHEGAYLVCNAANHYPDPTDPKRTPTYRTATERDMTLAIDEQTTNLEC